MAESLPIIEVRGLSFGYGAVPIMHDLNFTVKTGDVFVVMGVNGCGKSTLLKCMIGLKTPASGRVLYMGESFWDADAIGQKKMMHGFGVLYQSGALWSSLTVGENVALPMQMYTALNSAEIQAAVDAKLALVGLERQAGIFPTDLSGGMRRRAALARAIALDPKIIFLDEPSAGLDPINARKLDDLILNLRDQLGSTVVVITHELASIFAIANNSIFLDAESQTMIAMGDPKILLSDSHDAKVTDFLTRAKDMRRSLPHA